MFADTRPADRPASQRSRSRSQTPPPGEDAEGSQDDRADEGPAPQAETVVERAAGDDADDATIHPDTGVVTMNPQDFEAPADAGACMGNTAVAETEATIEEPSWKRARYTCFGQPCCAWRRELERPDGNNSPPRSPMDIAASQLILDFCPDGHRLRQRRTPAANLPLELLACFAAKEISCAQDSRGRKNPKP